jgi:RND family efflux transporter MFP subunit
VKWPPRIQEWLDHPRVARARPWLAPLGAMLVVALMLAPGLVDRNTAPPLPQKQPPAPIAYVLPPPAPVVDPPQEAVNPPPSEPPADAPAPDLASRFDCVIEPAEIVELGSPVAGVVQTLHVERGDFVHAGTAVAELESTVERAAVELARARSQMQGALRSREASFALGKRRNDRVNRLFENNTLSLDLRDQAETEAKIAELQLLDIQEHRRLAALELDQALALLRRRTIRSPISGVVVSREMAAGEVVVDERTILTVAQIDPLRVEVILPSALYGTVADGMRAAVEPELGDQVHIAAVDVVDRVIDAASGTFGVRLELPNPDHTIPGGLHCQVRFLAP